MCNPAKPFAWRKKWWLSDEVRYRLSGVSAKAAPNKAETAITKII
jgi:hypothetical protein